MSVEQIRLDLQGAIVLMSGCPVCCYGQGQLEATLECLDSLDRELTQLREANGKLRAACEAALRDLENEDEWHSFEIKDATYDQLRAAIAEEAP